jgi:hypothetical protein
MTRWTAYLKAGTEYALTLCFLLGVVVVVRLRPSESKDDVVDHLNCRFCAYVARHEGTSGMPRFPHAIASVSSHREPRSQP